MDTETARRDAWPIAHAGQGDTTGVKSAGENRQVKYLYIALGGALGSMARYWVGSSVGTRVQSRFPWGTFVVNLTACFVIGFVLEWLGKRSNLDPAFRFLIPVGFIGAYSTFSTFEWDALMTVRAGYFLTSALYVGGSVVAGFIAVWAGARLGDWLG